MARLRCRLPRARRASRPSTPLEQAYPLVFLCSDAAAAISGITLITDVGYISSGITESFPPAAAGRRLPARPDVDGEPAGQAGRRGVTATDGNAGAGTAAQHGVHDPHELVDLHERAAQKVARPAHIGWNSDNSPMSQSLANSVIECPSAAGAVADDDPGEADGGMLGPPGLDQGLECRLAGGVGARARATEG